jgi:hypothetical protein
VEKVSLLVEDTRHLSTIKKHSKPHQQALGWIPQSPHLLSTSHTNVVSKELETSTKVMHFSPRVMSVKELMNEETQ